MTDPTSEAGTAVREIPGLIGSGAQALIENANRLGLLWKLSLATVNNTDPLVATLDGDTTPIGVVSMVGDIFLLNERVYVVSVPPSGNFVIGRVNVAILGKGVGIDYNLSNGSTTSATPVAIPGDPAVAITKTYDDTLLHFVFSCTFFSTGSDAGPAFSANVPASSIDIQVGRLDVSNGSLNTRQQCAGQASASVAAGDWTFLGYWRRSTGAGTLFVATDDIWTMSVEEYWP